MKVAGDRLVGLAIALVGLVAVGLGSQLREGTSTGGPGTRRLTARAYDPAGNAGTSADVTVSVVCTTTTGSDSTPDTTPPVVSITALSSKWPKLTVSASATDDVGVSRVELYVDGKRVATDTGAPWAFTVGLKQFAPGTHTVVVKAYDAAGNAATSSPQTFTR